MKQSYEELQAQVQSLAAQRDGLIDELNKTQDEALDARTQRDALAAQVEVLRTQITNAREYLSHVDVNSASVMLDVALEAKPAACLAEVRAEAGKMGWIECARIYCTEEHFTSHPATGMTALKGAHQYAERILKGEVK